MGEIPWLLACSAIAALDPDFESEVRAQNQILWYTHPYFFWLDACPSGSRAGWAVRRFDSLVLSEAPERGLVLMCLGIMHIFSNCTDTKSRMRMGVLVNEISPPGGPATIPGSVSGALIRYGLVRSPVSVFNLGSPRALVRATPS